MTLGQPARDENGPSGRAGTPARMATAGGAMKESVKRGLPEPDSVSTSFLSAPFWGWALRSACPFGKIFSQLHTEERG